MTFRAAAIAALALAAVGLASQGWGAPAAAPPAAATPLDPRIEGAWVVDAAEFQMAPYKELAGATFTFKGDTFVVDRPGHSTWSGHVATDVKAGKIDLMHEADNLIPPSAGEKWEGIYKFDGPDLVINTAEAHDARPTEFLSGYDLALIRLKKKA